MTPTPTPSTPSTDVTRWIEAVDRTVGTRELSTGPARVVTVSRHFGEPVADVWAACTSAERIACWFLPVTGDLRPGGRYQIQGHAGGIVERCDPPRSFAVSWEYGEDVSGVEVRLAPEDSGTRFTLEHAAHVEDDR